MQSVMEKGWNIVQSFPVVSSTSEVDTTNWKTEVVNEKTVQRYKGTGDCYKAESPAYVAAKVLGAHYLTEYPSRVALSFFQSIPIINWGTSYIPDYFTKFSFF